VALAKTIMSKANFLLLDEPTNHLDIHSSELLINALNRYEGSFILVSHDRYFISKTANKIWEIVDHEIKEFKGTYMEWVQWKDRMAKAATTNGKPQHEVLKKLEEKKPPAPPKPETRRELEKAQKQFKQLEEKLAKLQTEKTAVESELAAPDAYKNPDKFRQTETRYQQILQQIQQAEAQYEKVFETIITLEASSA
jgi:ATP-binding cassette subfamily F protein 3